MKEQGTKITEKIFISVIEVMQVRVVVHGKEQGGTDLWLQLVKDCQRVHLNFQVTRKGFVALPSPDGWMAITQKRQVKWLIGQCASRLVEVTIVTISIPSLSKSEIVDFKDFKEFWKSEPDTRHPLIKEQAKTRSALCLLSLLYPTMGLSLEN